MSTALKDTLNKDEASYVMFYGDFVKQLPITEGNLYQLHKSVDSFKWVEKEHYIIDDEGKTNFTAMMAPKRKLYK